MDQLNFLFATCSQIFERYSKLKSLILLEFKKFPIQISESGYAPFEITIIFELRSKLVLINDEDCYKEPTRKYKKYLEQTFSYQLTFPQEGSAQVLSSSVLQVPFYTNNPKIIQQMNIHKTCRVYNKFAEMYPAELCCLFCANSVKKFLDMNLT